MALSEKFKIGTKTPNLYLSGYKGHFVAGRSHLNYYIDITSQKSCLSEAKAVAKAIAPSYKLHMEIYMSCKRADEERPCKYQRKQSD